jgi:hypothetical protein
MAVKLWFLLTNLFKTMTKIEQHIEQIEYISKLECATVDNHEENTKTKMDAHFRGVLRGKVSMAKETLIIIKQLQEEIEVLKKGKND